MPANELALDLTLEGHLPFDQPKQLAFLGHVMNLDDRSLYLQVADRIEADWFLDPWAGKLFKSYQAFNRKYNRAPYSRDEFMGYEDLRILTTPEKMKIDAVEKLSRVEMSKYGVDLLTRDLTDWMRCRAFHKSVGESARLFNGRQLTQAVSLLEQTVKEFQSIRFDGAAPATWDDPRALVETQAVDYDNALTTGINILDRHLNPDCKKGSLLRGDTTVLLAPTNIGKTTTMITIACHNLRKQMSVLFITREGREADIQEKFWQSMLGKTKTEFREQALSDDLALKERMKMFGSCLSRCLTYISMNQPDLTVEEVVSVIRAHQNRRRALNDGKGYDLLVMDYPSILTTEVFKNNKFEYRQGQDHIYRQFVQLGLEEKFHVLLAAQTNREGSKVNRYGNEEGSRLVTLEDIAESYAITHSATNLITVNRDEIAQAKNRITFYICKSRSSEVGWAVCCRSDFARAMTHGETLGGTAWRGHQTMSSTIDSLLKDWQNKDIPEGYVFNRS